MDACDLSTGVRERLDRRLEARVGLPPEAFDLPRFAGELPVAALVVHDQDDVEVPWAEGAAVASAWPGLSSRPRAGSGIAAFFGTPPSLAWRTS
jgi:hypothetical protein